MWVGGQGESVRSEWCLTLRGAPARWDRWDAGTHQAEAQGMEFGVPRSQSEPQKRSQNTC